MQQYFNEASDYNDLGRDDNTDDLDDIGEDGIDLESETGCYFEVAAWEVEIESNGNRYIEFFNDEGEVFTVVLNYDESEELLQALRVTTDRLDYRNQKAWEAVQKIRNLDRLDLGAILDCIKEVPMLEEIQSKESKNNLQETAIEKKPIVKSKIKIRLIRDLKIDSEHGMFKDRTFKIDGPVTTTACVKTDRGEFVTLFIDRDFEIICNEDTCGTSSSDTDS